MDVFGGGIAPIGSAVVKLRRLWAEVQDAPSFIKTYLDKLETLEQVLSLAEQHQTLTSPIPETSPLLRRSVSDCRQAKSNLHKMVSDLERLTNSPSRSKGMVGRMRTVLKKDALASHKAGLDDAIRLLSAAQQHYMM